VKNNQKGTRRRELDHLVDSGIHRIRTTWNRLGSIQLRAGPYGKQYLLQQIYSVYCDWRDRSEAKMIAARLRGRCPDESLSPDAHLLEILIRLALPRIRPNVVAIWVNAIRYGEDRHIRPFKLRGFFHVKGGLVRCARLFADEEENRRRNGEARRLEQQERELEIRQARRQARRRRSRPSMPVGMARLFLIANPSIAFGRKTGLTAARRHGALRGERAVPLAGAARSIRAGRP